MPGFGRIWARLAIGLSSLCLIHCLATPLLLLLLPAASTGFALPFDVHMWMLLTAVPVSILGLWSGHAHHRQCLPALAAFIGLAVLGYAAAFITNARLERVITVMGALCLAAAHFWNARLIAVSEPR